MRSILLANLGVIGLIVCLSTVGLAEDKKPVKPSPSQEDSTAKMTPETRKEMAEMYQKMANCLRSDKSLEQCGNEAMKDCPIVKKTGHCPIHEGTMRKPHQAKM